jgi:mannose/fructose/N-acetylgalactosamine-specific phosphotransferase system component IID
MNKTLSVSSCTFILGFIIIIASLMSKLAVVTSSKYTISSCVDFHHHHHIMFSSQIMLESFHPSLVMDGYLFAYVPLINKKSVSHSDSGLLA